MQRVEDVLGNGWESYLEGEKLKADYDNFKRRLSAKHVRCIYA